MTEAAIHAATPLPTPSDATVSVLLCVYRGDDARQLRESIESILCQTYPRLELLIHADGPLAAEHEAVLAKFERDSRMQIRRSAANRGLAHSLNALIAAVVAEGRATYIARMDADDIAFPDRIEKQVAHLEQHPGVDVLGTGCIEFRDDTAEPIQKMRRLPTDDATLKRRIVQRTPFIHPTVMFRRALFDHGIRYRVDNHRSEDTFLWADLAEQGCVFANLPDPLLYYRLSRQMIERRRSLRKATSDLHGRVYMMRRLGKVTPVNILATGAHFALKLLPTGMLERIYRRRG